MTGVRETRRTLVDRITGRLWRFVFGDRVLAPRRSVDPMWHLEAARHRIQGGEVIIRFDNLDADIALDARSDLALRALGEGSYEPDLLSLIPELIGEGDAINVGANVGLVAIVMRRAMSPGTRLLCVEPMEDCVDRLRRNLHRAGAEQDVIVYRAFATDKVTGSHEMWTVPGKPEYSSGARLVHPSVVASEHVMTTVPAGRLDDAIAADGLNPTCVVMDCEGGEFSALRGASRMLASCQPTLIMEFDPPLLQVNGGSAGAFIRFLSDFGYRSITLANPPAEATESFQGTLVAVPAKRLDAIVRMVKDVMMRCRQVPRQP